MLICATFGADLIDTSKVTRRITKWPRFLRHPVRSLGRASTALWDK